jgi:hypothetical protein
MTTVQLHGKRGASAQSRERVNRVSRVRAERAFLQRSYPANLKKGQPELPLLRTLLKVANALGVPVPVLLQDGLDGCLHVDA